MRSVLSDLLDLLRLERLEQNLYRGRSQDLGWGAVFGGQVLGQALSAATQTVPTERHVHSLHGYFLRQAAIPTRPDGVRGRPPSGTGKLVRHAAGGRDSRHGTRHLQPLGFVPDRQEPGSRAPGRR